VKLELLIIEMMAKLVAKSAEECTEAARFALRGGASESITSSAHVRIGRNWELNRLI
jgi:hypothetical protein